MKILVVGSNGMLGSDLLLEFQKTQHEVIGTGHRDLDITHQDSVKDFIQREQPEWVLLTAAFTYVDECETQRYLAWAVNAEGAHNVASASQEVGARLCYISTDYIFNGNQTEPYGEEDAPDPINFYAETKLKGENYVREILKDFLIIRTSWLFGNQGSNFVQAILEKAKSEPVLKVVNDQVGCPTYTRDLASAIILLIEKNIYGVVNVTNKGSCSWHEFAQWILKLAGIVGVNVQPINSQFLGASANRPANSRLTTSRFYQLTGTSLRPWQEALEDYIKTYSKP